MNLKSVQQNKRLIWLGAGNAFTPAIDFEQYTNVTLVEAREDACCMLRDKYKGQHIDVVNKLVYAANKPTHLNIYNISDYSSSREPSALKEWFPSLKLIAKSPVDSLSILGFLHGLGQDDEEAMNELVIDTPDIAYELLEELDKKQAIYRFNTVRLVYPVESIYEGMSSLESLTCLMEKLFYDISETASVDPDTKVYNFKFNPHKKLSSEFEEEKKYLETSLTDLREKMSAEIAEERLRAEELQKQADSKIKSLETKCNEIKTQSAKNISDIESKKEELVAAANLEKNQLKNKLREVEETILSLTKEREETKAKVEQETAALKLKALNETEKYKEQIRLYEKEVAKINAQNTKDKETFQQSHAELKEQNSKLSTENSCLEKKLSQLQKDHNKLGKQSLEQGNSLESFIHQCSMFFYGKAITYIDIGAFDGKVARSFFESNIRIAEAILVEPNPKSCQLLNATLESCTKLPKKLNIQNVGVSTREGPLRLYDNNSMSRIISTPSSELPDSVFEIPIMTLRDICSFCSEGQVSLLKVDVEGHEIEVLESGAELFINQQVDIVYIEAGLNPEGQQQIHYKLLDDFFLKYNYRLFRVFEQQYEWLEDSPFLRRWNMAYMSNNFANKHPYKLIKELFDLKRSKE